MKTRQMIGAAAACMVMGAAAAHAQESALPDDTDRVWTLETQYGDLPRHHARAFVDIVYDPEAEGQDDWFQRTLDVYVACETTDTSCRSDETFEIAQDRPVMIYIHGGASVGGDKQWAKDLGIKPTWALADLGYVFVSVNYRLREPGAYPNAQQDAANAIAWVYENIDRYGGNPEEIVVMGHSAGASLTSRVATDATFLENAGHDLSIIDAAITIDGGNMTEADGDVPAPVEQVALAENENIPPFLSLHVGAGRGSEEDAVAFAAALQEQGIDAQEVELVGYNHFTANEMVGVRRDSATVAVEQFLAEHGLLEDPSGGMVGMRAR